MSIAILINVRDRPTEVALLLQSLRTQTYRDFDIFILDDQSGTALTNYHFFNCINTRLKLEGHKVFMKRTDFPHGVSKARQAIVDWAMEGEYDYFVRVDDDVILESDYLGRLYAMITNGADIATGVTIPMAGPTFVRDPENVGEVINRVVLDDKGDYIFNGDDCGMGYTCSKILPAHHFRSCAMMTREVHDKVKYTPTPLSKHGFREEQIFSYKAQIAGFKILCDTGAENYHQITPSGGERFPDQIDLTKFNQEAFKKWTKEHIIELRSIFPEIEVSNQMRMKETNLA